MRRVEESAVRPSVLIADQDAADLLAYEAHFSRQGWLVSTAVDGEEARQLLAQHGYSLVVLRLRLPRISGRQLLESQRRLGRTTVPIVLMTNLTLDPDAERTLAEGAADYIHKPVSAEDLERRCQAVLARRSADA